MNNYQLALFNTNTSNVTPFQQANSSGKKWLCNVSRHYRFAKKDKRYLHVGVNNKLSQFDIMCKLLKANTCHTIYFDEPLSTSQLATIRVLQSMSNTNIEHARLSHMFSNVG